MYHHLTRDERVALTVLLRAGYSQRKLGHLLELRIDGQRLAFLGLAAFSRVQTVFDLYGELNLLLGRGSYQPFVFVHQGRGCRCGWGSQAPQEDWKGSPKIASF